MAGLQISSICLRQGADLWKHEHLGLMRQQELVLVLVQNQEQDHQRPQHQGAYNSVVNACSCWYFTSDFTTAIAYRQRVL